MKTLLVSIAVFLALGSALALGYFSFPSKTQATFYAAGIGENGQGVLVPYVLELKPGTGKILVDVKDTTYGEDVETSLRLARLGAENYLGVSLENYDISVDFPHRQQIVQGGSAGAAFTVSIIASYLKRPMRTDTAISATLKTEEEVGPVDGIEEKIIAASENGRKTFLIAADQPVQHEQQLKTVSNIVRIKTIKDAVDLLIA
ncbi:MAG TPA: S16 family serine protease [Candidatus Norongarragalinales archaeon]|jgi:ATP-dependent Lon protease|nr:S16 family serine protease [Candidatus Norongarragalinales archaeon]